MGARCRFLAVLASAIVVAGSLVSVAPAVAVRGHVFSGSFGKAGAGAGEFSEPVSVAVAESSGDVYVIDKGNDRVEYFSSGGAYLGQFNGSGLLPNEGRVAGSGGLPGEVETGQLSSPEGIALDNDPSSPSYGDVYVADVGHNVVDKFSATGEYVGQITQGSGGANLNGIYGVAVDTSGTVWVYQASNEVDAYSNSVANELLSSVQSSAFVAEPGFAVDSQDNMYVKTFFYGITKLNSSGSAVANEFDGLVNEPDSSEVPSGVAVDLGNNEVYIDDADGAQSVGRFSSSGSVIETFGAEHLTHGRGLAVDSTSETVYVVDAAANAIDAFGPEPAGAPEIANESVSQVTADSATFKATVNPHGANAEYTFEYGRCPNLGACATSGYEASIPAPDASVGGGFGAQSVSAHIQVLAPGSVYHFRAVAHNELGTTDGEERTLTTQPVGSAFRLPDGRMWEMVSPPQKEGAQFGWIQEGIVQASADGNAISDWSLFEPIEEKAQGAFGFSVANFFGRGPDGWHSKTIAPPHAAVGRPPVGNGQEYRMFSEDLSKAILQPFGPATPLTPEVSESTPYVRSDYLNGNSGELCDTGCYQPIVSSADTPAGTKYGDEPTGKCEDLLCGPRVLGASPDLSHVVLSSSVQLTTASTEGHEGLYEWSDGKLALISLLPAGETNERGGDVAFGAALGERDRSARHAISSDGSRIVWMGQGRGYYDHLYLRDTETGETARLDVPNTGVAPPGGEGTPLFMTASSDDSRVFFLDTERLTEDSTAKESYPQKADLYEFDLNAAPGHRLTDLTVDRNPEESANVAMVTGASEDGSYVYFTASGALAQGARPGGCGGNSGKGSQLCNLYVRHSGTTTLVAALSQKDFPDWSSDLSGLTARVSPNGRWLAFMSDRSLTGYDNTDVASGQPDEEVYLYHAPEGPSTEPGALACASCNPTGARPVGVKYESSEQIVAADRVFNTNEWIAANLPPWTRFDLSEVRYQSRYLSDSGRLFFDSHDALSPQDVNGTQDVYEYEPPGAGSCSGASVTFSERSGGCVSLISSGTSNEESAFLDASQTGGDVFFLTTAKLAAQDFDNGFDIYDARECDPQSRCASVTAASPPPCGTGDSCKPAPSPQPAIYGSPASATFSGAGNAISIAPTRAVQVRRATRSQKLVRALRACHRKRGRRRAVCERKARKRFTAKQSRKANATKKGRG